MKLPEKEKAAQRAAFRAMRPAQKLDHILTYYKWPILLGLIALVILGSVLHRQLTKKEPVLYLAFLNVSLGEDLEAHLTADYLAEAGFDEKRQEIYLYRGLYISENADTLNHEYAYASKMKLTGAISAKKLDLVLMNREAYDVLSQKAYLLDLSALLEARDPELLERLSPLLTKNEVVLSDNTLEVLLGEAEEERRVTEEVRNAISIVSLPAFRNAGFDGEVYLGIISNSERPEEALRFLRYLLS
jgi:hypothetical protein